LLYLLSNARINCR